MAMLSMMSTRNLLSFNGAAGEIRTPEVKHHWISNPAQWPGYATAADSPATLVSVMNMTVIKNRFYNGPIIPSLAGGITQIKTNVKNIKPR